MMTTPKEKILIAFCVAAVAAAAMASETVTYTYDVRGRLVQVKHSGAVNNNITTNYGYDKADNRTLKNTTGASQ
jgi:hypothetical protein